MEEDVATPTATTTNMFGDMPQSIDDEAFLHATNVANDDYVSHEYVSQEYATQYGDDNLDEGKKWKLFQCRGCVDLHRMEESLSGCICWKRPNGLFQERNMKGEMKEKKIKTFTFHHCYKELKDEEKWKTRETFDASKKKSVVIEDEEDVAAEEMELVEEKALK
ncbi:Threonyl-tRNA synthetase [Hordeum vulgare]|nr:Threonyl-tRNA synthetase [Hordeum vulgare]